MVIQCLLRVCKIMCSISKQTSKQARSTTNQPIKSQPTSPQLDQGTANHQQPTKRKQINQLTNQVIGTNYQLTSHLTLDNTKQTNTARKAMQNVFYRRNWLSKLIMEKLIMGGYQERNWSCLHVWLQMLWGSIFTTGTEYDSTHIRNWFATWGVEKGGNMKSERGKLLLPKAAVCPGEESVWSYEGSCLLRCVTVCLHIFVFRNFLKQIVQASSSSQAGMSWERWKRHVDTDALYCKSR